MREHWRAMLAVRVETLRSVLLPRHTAAEGVVLVLPLLLPALAVLVVASGQKVHRPALRQRTARAEVVVAARQQAETL